MRRVFTGNVVCSAVADATDRDGQVRSDVALPTERSHLSKRSKLLGRSELPERSRLADPSEPSRPFDSPTRCGVARDSAGLRDRSPNSISVRPAEPSRRYDRGDTSGPFESPKRSEAVERAELARLSNLSKPSKPYKLYEPYKPLRERRRTRQNHPTGPNHPTSFGPANGTRRGSFSFTLGSDAPATERQPARVPSYRFLPALPDPIPARFTRTRRV